METFLYIFRLKKVSRGEQTTLPPPPPLPEVRRRTRLRHVHFSPGEAVEDPSNLQRRTCLSRTRRSNFLNSSGAAMTSWRKCSQSDTKHTHGPSIPLWMQLLWACTTITPSLSSPWTWAPSGWDGCDDAHKSDFLALQFKIARADVKCHSLRKRWTNETMQMQENLLLTSDWCSPTVTNTIHLHMRWSTWQENCRFGLYFLLNKKEKSAPNVHSSPIFFRRSESEASNSYIHAC